MTFTIGRPRALEFVEARPARRRIERFETVSIYHGRRRLDESGGREPLRPLDAVLVTGTVAAVGAVFAKTQSIAATAIAAGVAVILGVVTIWRRR